MEGVLPSSGYAVQETRMIQETRMKFALIDAAALAGYSPSAPGIFWRALFDEGVKAFLAILRGRDKRKTLGRVLDRAAIVRVNRA